MSLFCLSCKVGIKFSKKVPYSKKSSIISSKKVINGKKLPMIKITLIKVFCLYIFDENVEIWPSMLDNKLTWINKLNAYFLIIPFMQNAE